MWELKTDLRIPKNVEVDGFPKLHLFFARSDFYIYLEKRPLFSSNRSG